jgi:hypothetical protein
MRAYHLLVAPAAAARPPVRAFVAWMLEQAKEERCAAERQFYGTETARPHGPRKPAKTAPKAQVARTPRTARAIAGDRGRARQR